MSKSKSPTHHWHYAIHGMPVVQWLLAACVAGGCFAHTDSSAQTRKPQAEPFATEAERCIVPASQLHQVNHFVLRAILRVESGLNPGAIGRNGNGTVDVGIGQTNSMHFRELAQHGVAPEHLRDACVGTYVAAWHLRKMITRYGNTMFAIAAYHSTTPYFNQRYQILISNELIRSGAMKGNLTPVPSITPGGPASAPAGRPPSEPPQARKSTHEPWGSIVSSIVTDAE